MEVSYGFAESCVVHFPPCLIFYSSCYFVLTTIRVPWLRCFPRSCGPRCCKHFSIVLTRKAIRQNGFFFHFLGKHSFMWRLVGTSKIGQCKTQTVHCRLKKEGTIHTADFLTEWCYQLYYRELTVNRLTGEYIQANPGADTEEGFLDSNVASAALVELSSGAFCMKLNRRKTGHFITVLFYPSKLNDVSSL